MDVFRTHSLSSSFDDEMSHTPIQSSPVHRRQLSRSDDDGSRNKRTSPMVHRAHSASLIAMENRSVSDLSQQLLFKEEKLQQAALYGMSLLSQLEGERESVERYRIMYETKKSEAATVDRKLEEERGKWKDKRRSLLQEVEALTERVAMLEDENCRLKIRTPQHSPAANSEHLLHTPDRRRKREQDFAMAKLELEAATKLQVSRIQRECDDRCASAQEAQSIAERLLTEERTTHNDVLCSVQREYKSLQLSHESLKQKYEELEMLYDSTESALQNERELRMALMTKVQHKDVALSDQLNEAQRLRQELESVSETLVTTQSLYSAALHDRQTIECALADELSRHNTQDAQLDSKQNFDVKTCVPVTNCTDGVNRTQSDHEMFHKSPAQSTIRAMRSQIRTLIDETERAHAHIRDLKTQHADAEMMYEARVHDTISRILEHNQSYVRWTRHFYNRYDDDDDRYDGSDLEGEDMLQSVVHTVEYARFIESDVKRGRLVRNSNDVRVPMITEAVGFSGNVSYGPGSPSST